MDASTRELLGCAGADFVFYFAALFTMIGFCAGARWLVIPMLLLGILLHLVFQALWIPKYRSSKLSRGVRIFAMVQNPILVLMHLSILAVKSLGPDVSVLDVIAFVDSLEDQEERENSDTEASH